MPKYLAAEYEMAEIRNRLREYFPGQKIQDYEISVNFESASKAFLYLGTRQFRFEKARGRWTCTRGIQD